jgi:carboxypeptidase Taq
MSERVERLRQRLREQIDIRHAAAVLEWDQQTMMPPGGAESRAESLATLERIAHEQFIDDETGSLLEAAAAELNGASPESDDASLVRVVRRSYDKSRRVPSELAADITRAGSIGQDVWAAARANSDFAAFAPYLERNVELARQYIACFDEFACPYDALLDDYDSRMTTAEVAALFTELRSELVPMIATLSDNADAVDASCLHGSFPIDRQRLLVAETVAQMGFDSAAWRMDDAVHPFATGIGHNDVRITTRWDEGYFPSGLYGAMHECGHGLYEAGIAPELYRTPLGHGATMSIHESQSRLWENMVGRGRPYCGVLAPRLSAIFGTEFDPDAMYRAVNKIAPSYIRVEADEATYGLHIVLRFELEQELIEGRLSVSDLPEAWNARFKEFFGIEVPDDKHGVLQDVHWSAGMIGYFPTYQLGNLIAGQLWQRVGSDIPDLAEQIAAGSLEPLREWLRENVHRYGAKFTTSELLERSLGERIEVGPFIAYLKDKLSAVYGVDL